MSRPKFKIKRGDTVKVIAGPERGQTGRVLNILPARARVVVEGINIATHHVKPTAERPGQKLEKEAPIHISNVALWNVDENRRVRVGWRFLEDGRKVRYDRQSGVELD